MYAYICIFNEDSSLTCISEVVLFQIFLCDINTNLQTNFPDESKSDIVAENEESKNENVKETTEDEPMDCTISGSTSAVVTSEKTKKADESVVAESESEAKATADAPMESV